MHTLLHRFLGGALLLGLLPVPALAQIGADSGDLLAYIDDVKDDLPGPASDAFVLPSAAEQNRWFDLISVFVAGRYDDAADSIAAHFPSYELVLYTDTGFEDRTYYVLRERADAVSPTGWGLYVVNPAPLRPVAFEVPHPVFDTNTHEQGIDLFRRTGAVFFAMAGTHRCANMNDVSPCDGTTSSCSEFDDDPNNDDDEIDFRASDVAHFAGTMFQQAHLALLAEAPQTYVFNLHGNSRGSCPDIFFTNGHATDADPLLFDLEATIEANSVLTVSVAGDGTTACTLLGTTNVQGRASNGALDPCEDSAGAATGFFVHVEQHRIVRDSLGAYHGGAQGGYGALLAAINQHIEATLPVELTAFDARTDGPDVLLAWETASETNNAGFEVQVRAVPADAGACGAGWTVAAFVEGHGTSPVPRRYAHRVAGLAPGAYRFRLRQVDYDGAFDFSPEVAVRVEAPGALALSAPYPNPFNPEAVFTLTLDRPQRVVVEAFDLLGRRVAVLHDGPLDGPAAHRLTFAPAALPGGAYFIRAAGEAASATRRVTYAK